MLIKLVELSNICAISQTHHLDLLIFEKCFHTGFNFGHFQRSNTNGVKGDANSCKVCIILKLNFTRYL